MTPKPGLVPQPRWLVVDLALSAEPGNEHNSEGASD